MFWLIDFDFIVEIVVVDGMVCKMGDILMCIEGLVVLIFVVECVVLNFVGWLFGMVILIVFYV